MRKSLDPCWTESIAEAAEEAHIYPIVRDRGKKHHEKKYFQDLARPAAWAIGG